MACEIIKNEVLFYVYMVKWLVTIVLFHLDLCFQLYQKSTIEKLKFNSKYIFPFKKMVWYGMV